MVMKKKKSLEYYNFPFLNIKNNKQIEPNLIEPNLREQKIYFHPWLITDIRCGAIFSVNIWDDKISHRGKEVVMRIFKCKLTHTYIVTYYVTYLCALGVSCNPCGHHKGDAVIM